MNAHFRWFVEECRALGKEVIDRCNLTIVMANPKYRDLPEFLARNQVHVVSSLPYFSAKRTDAQRGDGVFEDSIKALQLLNVQGYGVEGSGLILDLVYNPSGAYLPGDQATLEAEFKRQLLRKYDITFNSLFAITNLPVARFLDYLLESGNYTEYMGKLVEAYNPATVEGLMCRSMVSRELGRLHLRLRLQPDARARAQPRHRAHQRLAPGAEPGRSLDHRQPALLRMYGRGRE